MHQLEPFADIPRVIRELVEDNEIYESFGDWLLVTLRKELMTEDNDLQRGKIWR